jgi:hypothetical protein
MNYKDQGLNDGQPLQIVGVRRQITDGKYDDQIELKALDGTRAEIGIREYSKLNRICGNLMEDVIGKPDQVSFPKALIVQDDALFILNHGGCCEILTKDLRVGYIYYTDQYPNLGVRFYDRTYKSLSTFSRVHIDEVSLLMNK